MTDVKTMNRMLNRLDAEGIITGISKRVYCINGADTPDYEKIIEYYAENEYDGLINGDYYFYQIALIDIMLKTIHILSNKIMVIRNIPAFFIKKSSIISFTKYINCKIIRYL